MKEHDTLHAIEGDQHLFWRVEEIAIGQIGHESIVRLRALSQRPGLDKHGVEHATVLVPAAILRRAQLEVLTPARPEPEMPEPTPPRRRA